MAMAFGLRYAPSQPAGPQDSASAEAHCLQAFKAENTPAAFPGVNPRIAAAGGCRRACPSRWEPGPGVSLLSRFDDHSGEGGKDFVS
jgi:hypothetical protein